ncbi:hypothetical protein [Streptomyces sp. NBC_00102]|uniref:hypothetical protein n=1 Tax=Streptomyces sp. NBC_00102 TaxID=2975652 RepID=UPI002254D5F4|nr:hypothetical protein [Streptomyces sp. NBC_00102]MCX5399192.1 hypothetical protein [Streptomyces sp. NBC_00102]
MSQPVPPPSQPQPPAGGLPAGGQPVEGNPYAAAQPAAPAAAPTGSPAAPPAGAPLPPPTGAPVYPAAPGAPTGNPFAQQQPGQPGQPGQFVGTPFAPVAAPVRNNLALGLLASFGTALAVGAIYGGITGSTEREFVYAAVVVGLLVGWVAGKVGGRNPLLPIAAVVFSLGSVYFGQLLADAIMASKQLPVSVSDMFFQHFGVLQDIWKEDTDFLSVVFFGIAGFASFSAAKKISD